QNHCKVSEPLQQSTTQHGVGRDRWSQQMTPMHANKLLLGRLQEITLPENKYQSDAFLFVLMCLYGVSLSGTLSKRSSFEESEDTLDGSATARGLDWREDSERVSGGEDFSSRRPLILIPFCLAVVSAVQVEDHDSPLCQWPFLLTPPGFRDHTGRVLCPAKDMLSPQIPADDPKPGQQASTG
ncbi:hypothetical protein Q7C36_014688, partial [Tachysurus vachellii]